MTQNDQSDAKIHATVANYYTDKLATHGATPNGVDWRDADSQQLRHKQFDRLVRLNQNGAIADLGCGYGGYLTYLRETGFTGSYHGYDVSKEMIAVAMAKHGTGPDRQWTVAAQPTTKADFVVASGIFNVRGDVHDNRWEKYVAATIETMAASAMIGFGFNILTSWSDADHKRSDLYYADPTKWFNFCAARFGRSIAVMQDTSLYEFTLICRLQAK